ncbi:hypothetical protein DMC30DRAFT_210496, partial [Rhodotorula diobovata]
RLLCFTRSRACEQLSGFERPGQLAHHQVQALVRLSATHSPWSSSRARLHLEHTSLHQHVSRAGRHHAELTTSSQNACGSNEYTFQPRLHAPTCRHAGPAPRRSPPHDPRRTRSRPVLPSGRRQRATASSLPCLPRFASHAPPGPAFPLAAGRGRRRRGPRTRPSEARHRCLWAVHQGVRGSAPQGCLAERHRRRRRHLSEPRLDGIVRRRGLAFVRRPAAAYQHEPARPGHRRRAGAGAFLAQHQAAFASILAGPHDGQAQVAREAVARYVERRRGGASAGRHRSRPGLVRQPCQQGLDRPGRRRARATLRRAWRAPHAVLRFGSSGATFRGTGGAGRAQAVRARAAGGEGTG